MEIKVNHLSRGEMSEVEEVELGYKWAFHDDLERSLLMAAALEVEIPVDGGDDDETWIPFLSLAKGLGDFTFQGTLRSHLPGDDLDRGDVALSGIVHWMHSPWPRKVFPGLEGTVTVPIDGGDLEATFIPHLFLGLSRAGHVTVTVDVEVPATGLDYDYRLRVFLLWDLADGPFWAGW